LHQNKDQEDQTPGKTISAIQPKQAEHQNRAHDEKHSTETSRNHTDDTSFNYVLRIQKGRSKQECVGDTAREVSPTPWLGLRTNETLQNVGEVEYKATEAAM
jgi:hypothetical protein